MLREPNQSAAPQEQSGTPEYCELERAPHLLPPPDPRETKVKQQLRDLRIEITRLVTGLRWEEQAITATADAMIPLLHIGNVAQWKDVLIPFLYEIDRSGTFLPVWIDIIMRGDPPGLPQNTNPAETMEGCARRFAILMLGNYKTVGIRAIPFSKSGKDARQSQSLLTLRETQDLTHFLGILATDPNTSLYATQALLKHANLSAMQALVEALNSAIGWAKVDVVGALLSLQQEQFYPFLIASGLYNAAGLESYIATPLYCTIPLAPYLCGNFGNGTSREVGTPHTNNTSDAQLQQQAALIFHQVLYDTLNQPLPTSESTCIPIVFERDLPLLVNALFTGAQQRPQWQNTVALHRLSLLIGRYWHAITQHQTLPRQVLEQVEYCLTCMSEIEAWLNQRGRATLLTTIADPHEEHLLLSIGVLQELHEVDAIPLLQNLQIQRPELAPLIQETLHSLTTE
jgi:hypothetical protein